MLRVLAVTAVCAVRTLGCASSRDQPTAIAARDGGKQAPAQRPAAGGLQSRELFDALAQMDRALLEASFETCDAGKVNAIFAADVGSMATEPGWRWESKYATTPAASPLLVPDSVE